MFENVIIFKINRLRSTNTKEIIKQKNIPDVKYFFLRLIDMVEFNFLIMAFPTPKSAMLPIAIKVK